MSSLLNAAKYLAKTRNFQPIFLDDPVFDDPIVLASQKDTFEAIHILSCLANRTDPKFIRVRSAVDWLNQAAKAANV